MSWFSLRNCQPDRIKYPLVVEPCWPNLLNSKKTHWTNPEIQKSRNPIEHSHWTKPMHIRFGTWEFEQCVLSRVTPLAGWARSARRKDPWLGSDVLDSLPSGSQTWLENHRWCSQRTKPPLIGVFGSMAICQFPIGPAFWTSNSRWMLDDPSMGTNQLKTCRASRYIRGVHQSRKSHLRWDVKRPGFEILRPKSGESWKMKIRNWLGTRPGKRLQKANWENHHL